VKIFESYSSGCGVSTTESLSGPTKRPSIEDLSLLFLRKYIAYSTILARSTKQKCEKIKKELFFDSGGCGSTLINKTFPK
jgi:hypothetical protein